MKLSFSDVPKKARTTSLSFTDGKMNLSRASEKWSSRAQTLEIWQICFLTVNALDTMPWVAGSCSLDSQTRF